MKSRKKNKNAIKSLKR
jgi:hypothetical protein